MRNLILLAVISLMPLWAYAQSDTTRVKASQEDPESYTNEVEKAEKACETLKADIDGLTKEIADLKEEISKLGKEKKSIASDKKNAEGGLKNLEKSKEQKQRNDLLKAIDDWNKKIQATDERILSVKKQIDGAEEVLDEQEQQKAKVSAKMTEKTTDFVAECKQYIAQPFSKLTHQELQNKQNECARLIQDQKGNQELRELAQSIRNVDNNHALYNNLYNVITTPYDSLKVEEAKVELRKLKSALPAQEKEVGELRDGIQYYEPAWHAFRQFNQKLAARRKLKMTANEFNSMKNRLAKSESGLSPLDLINKVPYLKKRFNDMEAEIKANPEAVSQVELEIGTEKPAKK